MSKQAHSDLGLWRNSVLKNPRCGFSMTIWATPERWANTASTGERHIGKWICLLSFACCNGMSCMCSGVFVPFYCWGSKKKWYSTRTLNFAYLLLGIQYGGEPPGQKVYHFGNCHQGVSSALLWGVPGLLQDS